MRLFQAIIAGGIALAASSAWAQNTGPLKIGVLDDMSGAYSDLTGKGSIAAAELAVEDFGKEVLGRPIEIVSADHQNKADIGAGIARKWYEADGVEMITGMGNSGVALAVRELAKANDKIDIPTGPGTNDLTGKACSATGFHFNHNNFALAKTVASATVQSGGDTIYMVAADYTFGQSLADSAKKFAIEAGGKILGQVNTPMGTADFSSFILQAQTSGAKNIGLAIAGQDLINFIKQASQFGVTQGGQSISAYILFVNDIKALTLETAKGLNLAETFYWDTDDETRAFSKRFMDKVGAMPNGLQAGTYSAVLHYLKAVKAADTVDAEKVAEQIRTIPVNDFFSKELKVREDGRVMRDFHLFQVKTPEESTGEWDLMTKIGTIPDGGAFESPEESECPLLKKS
jgi:branched-chain amino acid transport system substrate-binding protein